MRTISGIGKLLRKVNEVILTEFSSAITGRALGIPIFEKLYEIEY